MAQSMTFDQAKDFKMPFGKHKGKTFDAIAHEDRGLLYLDWLRGQRVGKNWPEDSALAAYLGDPTIKAELEKAMGVNQ